MPRDNSNIRSVRFVCYALCAVPEFGGIQRDIISVHIEMRSEGSFNILNIYYISGAMLSVLI